jgi:radical SAM protein (TIGR01212 family)
VPQWPGWRLAGLRYHSLSFFFRKKFAGKVWKVSVDGGFTCPNRDGTLGDAGCIFCDPESFSPSRRLGLSSITAQIEAGIGLLKTRRGAERFVAYFQPASNSYAPLPRLRDVYEEALAHPQVVGLAIGTRPDCVGDDVLDLLAELSGRTWLQIEYGLQTIHDRTLRWLNRGHGCAAFFDAVARSRARRLPVGAHVILGLPGETRDDMLATARTLAQLKIDAVKLHNLYAVKGTRLAAMVAAGEVQFAGLTEYAGWVVDFLEQLPPDCVVDRLSGEAPPSYLIGPDWCLQKSAVRAAIAAEFQRRDTWQGKHFQAG